MADFRPFRGLRYNPRLVPDISPVLCPPYDVITPQLQEELYRRSPYNIVRLEYGKAPPEGGSGLNRYTVAAQLLQEWRRQGVLVADSRPAFYLLQEDYADSQGKSRIRHALFGRVRIEKFSRGVVLPHEETSEGAKRDRLELLSACQANLSPIMGLYRDSSGRVSNTLQEAGGQTPLSHADGMDGQRFTLWRISQRAMIDTIQEALGPQSIYLADGHHRYETALRYRDIQRRQGHQGDGPSFVMMALVELDDPGLQLLGYHRLLKGLDPQGEGLLARYLKDTFEVAATVELPGEVEEASRRARVLLAESASQGRAIGLVDWQGRRFRLLALREEAGACLARQSPTIPELAECDVWTLHEGVLNPLLATQAQEHTLRLEYVHDEVEALRQLQEGMAQVAFLLRPLPLKLFEGLVRQGVRLPPKSTYFSPKLPTGLVVRAFGV